MSRLGLSTTCRGSLRAGQGATSSGCSTVCSSVGVYGCAVEGDTSQRMVGRDRELARVTSYLDDALAGRGRLVLCTGEAGVGKTRLAEEVAALAAARGVPVAWPGGRPGQFAALRAVAGDAGGARCPDR